MDSDIQNLYDSFLNPASANFGSINIKDIYSNAKRDATQFPVPRHEIQYLQTSLEQLSKQKERRILKGQRRKASFRKWITHSPRHILLGDLCFLRNLNSSNKGMTTILVLQDAFSR